MIRRVKSCVVKSQVIEKAGEKGPIGPERNMPTPFACRVLDFYSDPIPSPRHTITPIRVVGLSLDWTPRRKVSPEGGPLTSGVVVLHLLDRSSALSLFGP